MSENINEKWISIEEAAEHLGIKPVTVRDWIKKGKGIPAHKIGKKWKFKYSELDAWVKSGQSAIEQEDSETNAIFRQQGQAFNLHTGCY